MSAIKVYTRFKNDGAPRPVVKSALPSLTQQQFAKEADINVLIDRYKRTGSFYNPMVPSGTPRMPRYEDISEMPDMMEQLESINRVNELFASLPASVREQFGHNPATFVEFAQNPANFDKCVELGIFNVSEKPTPSAPAEVVKDETAAAVEQSAQ